MAGGGEKNYSTQSLLSSAPARWSQIGHPQRNWFDEESGPHLALVELWCPRGIMDISYHSGSVYAPSQPPAKRHSLSSAPSTRQEQRPYTSHKANVQNHSAPVPPHLPSLAPQNYVNAGAGSTASRSSVSRALQVSSIQTTHEGSYLYMPHGLPQFNHADTSLIQSQQSFTASHLQRPSPTVHDFPPSHAYAPQNSNAVPYLPYSPPIAAPARFPDIRPMPAGGLNEAPALPGSQKPASSASLALQNGQETQPTHVVGSQGRRGILPSADGRPTAVPTGTANGQKVGNVPLKDEDGKFPCPHCAKTYLHAKHLKRHLLRRKCPPMMVALGTWSDNP